MREPSKRWIVEQLATNPIVAAGPLGPLWRFVSKDVWQAKVEQFGLARRALYRACRVAYLTARSFAGDNCMVRAAALTYTTVLSLVPMLAFSFAILKGLGVYEDLRASRIDPYLDDLFGPVHSAPLTVESPGPLMASTETAPEGMAQLRQGFEQVLGLVDRTNVKALGALGLLVLLLAALQLLSSIESSFNEIWGVRKARSWVRKLSDYLTILVVTPIFLVVAVGVTTAAQNAGVVEFAEQRLALGFLFDLLIKLAPVLVGWLAFTLVYMVMPNRRTRFASALLGGFVASALWQLALVGHIAFQIGVAKYNAIYAGFAAFPIFLVWVQLSWQIVLFGAELAYAHESESEYHGLATYERHEHAYDQQVAVRALASVCDAFLAGQPARDTSSIAARLGVSPRAVEEVLSDLARGGLLSQSDPTDPSLGGGWLPARDPGLIRVVDVLEVLRGEGRDNALEADNELDRLADRSMSGLEAEARSSAHNRSLRELVEEARRRSLREGATATPASHAQPVVGA